MKNACDESRMNFSQHKILCNTTVQDLIEEKETYVERSLGFLIVGFTGIFPILLQSLF